MENNDSKKIIIKLKQDEKEYFLLNDGSIKGKESGKILDKEKDSILINKIMDRFRHGFSDDV